MTPEQTQEWLDQNSNRVVISAGSWRVDSFYEDGSPAVIQATCFDELEDPMDLGDFLSEEPSDDIEIDPSVMGDGDIRVGDLLVVLGHPDLSLDEYIATRSNDDE